MRRASGGVVGETSPLRLTSLKPRESSETTGDEDQIPSPMGLSGIGVFREACATGSGFCRSVEVSATNSCSSEGVEFFPADSGS